NETSSSAHRQRERSCRRTWRPSPTRRVPKRGSGRSARKRFQTFSAATAPSGDVGKAGFQPLEDGIRDNETQPGTERAEADEPPLRGAVIEEHAAEAVDDGAERVRQRIPPTLTAGDRREAVRDGRGE